MTTRQWKLVVTEMGSAAPLAEAVVEAPNWMAGIKLARGRIGEPEAIPQGASCTVAPDGRVTVFDAVRRRSYVLMPLLDTGTPASTVSYPPGVFTASQVPPEPPRNAPLPAAMTTHQGNPSAFQPPSAPLAAGAPAPRQRPKTMAYILEGPLPVPAGLGNQVVVGAPPTQPVQYPSATPAAVAPQAAPQIPPTMAMPQVHTTPLPAPLPQPPSPSAAKAAMRRTMAFVPGQFDLPPLPTREVVVGAPAPQPTAAQPAPAPAPTPAPVAAPQPTAPAAAATTAAPGAVRVAFERSVEPNDESPLHYHAIGLHMPGERSTVDMERAMFAQLDRVRKKLGANSEGHFVQVLVYRDLTTEPEAGSEVGQLTWRGWRRESSVRFPQLEAEVANQSIPGAERYPSAAQDPRLADVLDAFEDVWFLATPTAVLEFAARVIEDLFADVHVLVAGLAPDGPSFVTTSVHGDLPAYMVPPKLERKGLVEIALGAAGRPVILATPSADPRVDAGAEGLATGPMLAAVAPHGGDALGYVRLARAKGGAAFTPVDGEIMRAIVERLGLFLRLRGAVIVPAG